MAKIGIDSKEYMKTFRGIMLPEMVKRIHDNFPKGDLSTYSTEVIQSVFRATTLAAMEDYFTFALERIIEENNSKIYEDLVRLKAIEELPEEETEELPEEETEELPEKKTEEKTE